MPPEKTSAGTNPGGQARVRVEAVDGERRLVVDGVVQSVFVDGDEAPRGYWPAMVPTRRPASALILGLGGGTLAHLVLRRYGALPIVGVDNDGAMLAIALNEFDLDPAVVSIVEADANAYVRHCSNRFDFVAVDLFTGETLAEFATSGAFLRRVRGLVKPGGTLVWNAHRDRRGQLLRRRAARGLRLERRVLAGLNLVLHLRRGAHRKHSRARPSRRHLPGRSTS